MKYLITAIFFVFYLWGIAQANEDIFSIDNQQYGNNISVDDYIRKAGIYFQMEEYSSSINLYRECYKNTGNILCVTALEVDGMKLLKKMSDYCCELVNLTNKYSEDVERQIKDGTKDISWRYYYAEKIIFPEKFPIFKNRYVTSDLDKIRMFVDAFSVLKRISQLLVEVYSDCIMRQHTEKVCSNRLKKYREMEEFLKRLYEARLSDIVRVTLNSAYNKVSEARNLITFNDKDLLREAAKIMGQFDGDLIKTCNQDTRMFFVEVYTYLKKHSPEALMEEFKILNTLQSNVNTGRTGADLWWSK